MSLDFAILAFLDREPMSGYDLKTRCFDDAVGHIWTADQAQVYRTLERMQERGLVKAKLVPQRGKPDRKVFSITAKGGRALSAWLREEVEPSPMRDPFLLRLALAQTLDDDELAQLLADARERYQARLEALRAEAAAPPPRLAATDPRGADLFRMTLAAAMSATRSAIDWIDDCRDRIASGLPKPARTSDEGA